MNALRPRTRRLVAPAAAVMLAGAFAGVAFSDGAEAIGGAAGRAHPVVVKGHCDGTGRWRMELAPSDDGEGMSGEFRVSGLRPGARWGGALGLSYQTSPHEGVGMSSELAGRVHKDGRINIGFDAPSHYRSHVEIGLMTRNSATYCSAEARSRF